MHKKTICIAALFPGHKKATEWTIEHNETSIRRLVKKLQRESGGGEIRACYEAGPCGYALQRRLAKSSIVCEVIAPSLVPVKPGERKPPRHRPIASKSDGSAASAASTR